MSPEHAAFIDKSNGVTDETKIKTLTGGDKITARFMKQDFFDFVPTFKLSFAETTSFLIWDRLVDAFQSRLIYKDGSGICFTGERPRRAKGVLAETGHALVTSPHPFGLKLRSCTSIIFLPIPAVPHDEARRTAVIIAKVLELVKRPQY